MHYELDDVVTAYFIINTNSSYRNIRAWTYDKELAKAYLEFHKCKNFKLKERTDTLRGLIDILNENANDEIHLTNIIVKNPNGRSGKEAKTIVIPVTDNENTLIRSETSSYLATRIDYRYANSAFEYLKDKYTNALKKIFFKDIMYKVIHGRVSTLAEEIELDELLVFLISMPEEFGE